MRVFILRARKGITAASGIHDQFGDPNHFEIILHTIASALFISKHLRSDTVLHIVLEGPPEPPKVLTFDPGILGYLGGFDEKSLAEAVGEALAVSKGISGSETRSSPRGIKIRRQSFEKLVRETGQELPLFILSKKGSDIRSTELPGSGCFILTDHIGMQKKTGSLLKRLGVKEISLGPRMLFAAHCVVLVHNELDRRENGR
ncbi:MAG: tRNA (pseudouridine(54)-N(1))-methyltransferase TrmY [Spirochaetia bacterium]